MLKSLTYPNGQREWTYTQDSVDVNYIYLDQNHQVVYKWDLFLEENFDTETFIRENIWNTIEKAQIFIEEYLVNKDAVISLIYVDHEENEVLCYTDFLWQHSLYVNDNWDISWSINELKNYYSVLDYRYLWIIRKFWYNINDLTPYVNIRRLKPGMIYRSKIWKTFRDSRCIEPLYSSKELKLSLFDYLETSLRNRLIKDKYKWKTIWVLVSWWLDSSMIASLLIKNKPEDVEFKFFTTENAEDSKYAKELAEFLGIELIYVNDIELTDEEIFETNETPVDLGSVIPNIKLMKALAAEWIQTVFTWDGPDELLRWYRRNAEDFDYHYHDIFNELTYYHFPRLEKAATKYGIELVCPYTSYSIISYALTKDIKIYKQDLKDIAHWYIPQSIIDRTKEPLKNKAIREDKVAYQHEFLNKFISYAKKNEDLYE